MNPRPRPKGLQGMDAFLLSRFSLHIQNQSLLKPGSLSRFAPPSRRNYSILATRHGCVMSFFERRGIAPGLSAPCGPGLLPRSPERPRKPSHASVKHRVRGASSLILHSEE